MSERDDAVRDLVMELKHALASVHGVEPRVGPYAAIEAMRSALLTFVDAHPIDNEFPDDGKWRQRISEL